ncbi:MAG TPA: hypothetical protein VFF68_11335, partial [Anaerolineaceae bacterium]|nr:hypothetical protein [Anaerolineaceae bacterium]
MKPQPFHSLRRNRIDLLALLFLLLALAACQTGAPTTAPDGPSNLPVENPSPAASGANATAPGGTPEGGFDLAAPAVGIDQFSAYRQEFSVTLNGALQGSPYEESQALTRQVAGSDESLKVNEGGTEKEPLYLVSTRLGDYRYTQERENAPCRAEPAAAG